MLTPVGVSTSACTHVSFGVLGPKLPRDHEDEIQERLAVAAATASPETLLGDTVTQLTQPGSSLTSPAPSKVRSRRHSADAKQTRSPTAWTTTIRSSPEFRERMSDLGLASTEHENNDSQRPAASTTTVELQSHIADLRTTVVALEDENAKLKDELEEVRRQGKDDLALAVRKPSALAMLQCTNCCARVDGVHTIEFHHHDPHTSPQAAHSTNS